MKARSVESKFDSPGKGTLNMWSCTSSTISLRLKLALHDGACNFVLANPYFGSARSLSILSTLSLLTIELAGEPDKPSRLEAELYT